MPTVRPILQSAQLGALIALAPAAVVLALAFGPDPVALRAAKPLLHREGGYVGSAACLSCHPDHHASWERTYHSTMTQRPERARVRGAFDGQRLRYLDQQAVPFERGEDFVMQIDEGRSTREAIVAKLVGSRRYQQYFERIGPGEDDASFRRLPWLWHIDAQRWLHVNTIFLGPDDADPSTHLSRWNENCIFCHNTGPKPGLDTSNPAAQHFDSSVAELGIACEACHGPGAAHSASAANPWQRYVDTATHASTIVDPSALDAERSAAICGQCHAQRLPEPTERIRDFLTSGPSFRPGDRLEEHVRPLARDTPPLPGAPAELFADRFWQDGTARLSAYEYQGLRASPCFQGGNFTCLSCHAMHRGDPRGQLDPDRLGDAACTSCHQQIAAALSAHTKHAPDSPGSRCVECHMPRIAYGILDIHRSHRIEVPDPKRDAELARPNACTLCHLDRTASWAAKERGRLWNLDASHAVQRGDGAPVDLPDSFAQLLSGDAVQRAVAARAFGRLDAATTKRARASQFAALLLTLADGYPGVRFIAHQSLLRLDHSLQLGLRDELQRFETLADLEERRTRVQALLESLRLRAPAHFDLPSADDPILDGNYRWKPSSVLPLLELQTSKSRVLFIGE